MTTIKYIVLRVEIQHEPDADLRTICEEVEVFCDNEDGAINTSKVVDVTDEPPTPFSARQS